MLIPSTFLHAVRTHNQPQRQEVVRSKYLQGLGWQWGLSYPVSSNQVLKGGIGSFEGLFSGPILYYVSLLKIMSTLFYCSCFLRPYFVSVFLLTWDCFTQRKHSACYLKTCARSWSLNYQELSTWPKIGLHYQANMLALQNVDFPGEACLSIRDL